MYEMLTTRHAFEAKDIKGLMKQVTAGACLLWLRFDTTTAVSAAPPSVVHRDGYPRDADVHAGKYAKLAPPITAETSSLVDSMLQVSA
jgi:hypothetical protein